MHHLVNNVIKPIAIGIAAIVLGMLHQGCQPAKDAIDSPDTAYTLETAACVSSAKTVEESHQCRSKVNWKYGLCPDSSGEILCQ